ncbi:ABC-three component system middle component 7 [Paenibacillus sediminis]|uniref:Uncharacterized protein n=1 Tax=Paenibacillus sediminis TaxID=664909 RepID=A0ABS4H624_9BACL|nr:hypothetical protein [Paenibacillus sediminis]
MLTPNKIIRFNESIIGKIVFILKELNSEGISIQSLFHQTDNYFDEIEDFLYSLDVLYLLDSIEVDFEKGVIKYVKTN